jgi:Sulfotransferase domain
VAWPRPGQGSLSGGRNHAAAEGHALMPRPSFFIVGAPKCGTTSLCHYLGQHPDIFIPELKELNFFASDLDLHRYYGSEREYVDAFQNQLGKKICGEGTVWYLYSETAASEIKSFNRDAKIIISLRSPSDMAYSLYRHRIYVGCENIHDFSTALEQQERDADCATDHHAHWQNVTGRIYTLVPMYYQQVARYLDVFSHLSVKIVLFEDLKDSASKVYNQICQFIGVSPDSSPALDIQNPGKQWKSNKLQSWQRHPPESIKRMWHFLPLSMRSAISRHVRGLNTRVAAPALESDLRRRLNDLFRPDVARLSELIGRDLTHWLTSPAEARYPHPDLSVAGVQEAPTWTRW